MKAGKTLQELAVEVDRQARTKRDFVASTKLLGYSSTGGEKLKIEVAGQEESFEVADTFHDQLGSYLSIPKKYYDRMRQSGPYLLEQNINYWLTTQEKDSKLVRTLDGKARALLSPKYRALDNFDLLESVLPKLTELEATVESCEVTEKRLYLKVVTPKVQYEIKKGDVVQAGLVISNSEIGMGSLGIEPLIYRLVCTNGMIANDRALRKYHVGRAAGDLDGAIEYFRDETRMLDDKAFWSKVSDVVAGSLETIQFGKIVESMQSATQDKIEADPVQVVEVVSKRFTLNDSEKTGVMAHLIGGGDLTRYGLVNAITRHSQDVKSYDRATELERLGGEVLELPRRDWEVISTAVN